MNRLYLVLDQGSHASRAVVFDARGSMVSSARAPVASRQPRNGWVEHDPEQMLASLRRVLDEVMHGLPAREMVAALATQRSSIVCWNRQTGRALSPVISWQDVRAAAWMDGFSGHRRDIHAATGLFPSPHYGAGKLHWCLHHLPAVKQALQDGDLAWGPLASFLLFRLLRERPLLTDPGNASRTLLWNMHTLDWDPQLLELFALPDGPLPQCVPSRHDFGHLDISRQNISMQVVMGDLPASLFAAGRPQSNTVYINAGTGAFVQRVIHKPPKDTNGFLIGMAYQAEDTVLYSLEGTVNGAGSALEWFKQEIGSRKKGTRKKGTVSLFHSEKSKLSPFFHPFFPRPDPIFEESLPEWLQREGDIPLFLNGVSGLGSPFWHPGFASRFAGEGEVWQQAVAVVESIVFLLQINLEGMTACTSPPVEIRLSGGLAGLDGFCRKLASLSGVPVHRPVQLEATARGCAFLLANCPHHWPQSDAGALFRPHEDAGLRRRYARWKALMGNSL